MAKQKSVIRVKGTIQDLTFSKGKDGYGVKEKSEVSRETIMTSKNYARVRENMSEFGRAGKASKLLRQAFRSLIQNAKDRRSSSRLTGEMMVVLKSDSESLRGERTVSKGDIGLLNGFDFNINGKLSTIFFVDYETFIDRPAGNLKVDLDGFTPGVKVVSPAGATHFRIVSAGAEIDFDNDKHIAVSAVSEMIPVNGADVPGMSMVHTLTPAGTLPLFLTLGIEFFQEVNGRMYPLLSGEFNSFTIVNAES